MTDDEIKVLCGQMNRTFATPDGTEVLKSLSKFCLEGQNPLVVGSFDQTARNCGKLSVILMIRKIMSSGSAEDRQTKVVSKEERK